MRGRGGRDGMSVSRRCLEEDRLRFSSRSGKEKKVQGRRRYMRGGKLCLVPSPPPFDLGDFLPAKKVGESEKGKEREREAES